MELFVAVNNAARFHVSLSRNQPFLGYFFLDLTVAIDFDIFVGSSFLSRGENIQLYEIDFIRSQYAEVTNISEDIKYVVFHRSPSMINLKPCKCFRSPRSR